MDLVFNLMDQKILTKILLYRLIDRHRYLKKNKKLLQWSHNRR